MVKTFFGADRHCFGRWNTYTGAKAGFAAKGENIPALYPKNARDRKDILRWYFCIKTVLDDKVLFFY